MVHSASIRILRLLLLLVLWRQSCCYDTSMLPVPGRCASLDGAVDPCASIAYWGPHQIRLPLRPLQQDRSQTLPVLLQLFQRYVPRLWGRTHGEGHDRQKVSIPRRKSRLRERTI